MDFLATCAPGLEELLGAELTDLKARGVAPERGVVRFTGEPVDALRACLWSRLASTIGAVVCEVSASGTEELGAAFEAFPWEDVIGRGLSVAARADGSAPIGPRGASSALRKAVDRRLLDKTGALTPKGATTPDIVLNAWLGEGADGATRATVTFNLSGEPLWKRGYEKLARRDLPAMRSDVASALLIEGGWGELVAGCEGEPATLAVMFSGAGTLIAEAAAMALRIAPGLFRGSWGFTHWRHATPNSWRALVRDAERKRRDPAELPLRFLASDVREGWRARPRAVLRSLGLDLEPEILQPTELARASKRLGETTLWAADLSFAGSEGAEVAAEAALVPFLASLPKTAPGIVACDLSPEALLGAPAAELDVALGRNRRRLLVYAASRVSAEPVEVAGHEALALSSDAGDFRRAITRNYEARVAEAAAEDVSCYRLYDREIPTYNLAIDLYEGARPTPGRRLVISEFEAPASVDAATARGRLLDACAIACLVTGTELLDAAIKVRRHAKGGSQYRSAGAAPSRRKPRRIAGAELPPGASLIEEGGLLFEVDLEHHLDTGIFLDTRDVRSLIREKAKGIRGRGRFLNLFGYTGTATVYAADGGCEQTTTVDLSATYLGVAERNLRRNGFFRRAAEKAEAAEAASGAQRDPRRGRPAPEPHRFIREDALAWLARERRGRRRYDLIWCDPPTFSNSRATGRTFDVQADHADLIIGVSRLLAPGGLGIFCCNLSSFKPDLALLERAGVELTDITGETIPFDFSRERPPHHCYLVRRA